MNFILKSILNKAIALFLFLALLTWGEITLLNSQDVTSVPISMLFWIVVAVLLVVSSFFILGLFLPVRRVAQQVLLLLTGKSYKRIEPTTIDEIGVFTHFFNEITQDLEKISHDLKERRRMSSELDIAASIQRDVLPKVAPDTPGLDIVAKNRAAAEVGGDVFDFLESPDHENIYIYIGDVTGHGVPAGLVMMMADTLVQSMVSQGMQSSQEIIVNTNKLLTPRISSRLFMTTVMLRWNKREQRMYYTGAGHEHILVYRAQGEGMEAIRSGGIALGMIPDNSKIAIEKEIPLQVGDCIVLYSDGITEAKNKTGEMYGLDRLKESFRRAGFKPSAESIFDNVTKDFQTFVREYVQIDDITMIVIKIVSRDAITGKVKLMVNQGEAGPALAASKIWNWTL